jgi:hypothetical protein
MLYLQDVKLASVLAEAALQRDEGSWEAAYHTRIQWSHWYESVDSLNKCADRPEIKSFLERLFKRSKEAKKNLRSARSAFNKHNTALGLLRNQTFHYPSPSKRAGQREGWAEILKVMAPMLGKPFIVPQGKVRHLRYPAAEDIAVGRIYEAVGGERKFESLLVDLGTAIQDYNRFVMKAIHQAVEEGGLRYLERDMALAKAPQST